MVILSFGGLVHSASASTVLFGAGANQFSMDFVDVRNSGNSADSSGYGAVNYKYKISTYEVSESMISVYNAISGEPAITIDSRGDDRPATSVSWNEAARFINWLNVSSGYSVAYKFTSNGANDNIALWEIGDAGYDASNLYRNSNARFYLPSEDEWYKAAYYDPNHGGSGVGGYWDYATGSDVAPVGVTSGTVAGTAVYDSQSAPANVNDAGGLSAYGTMAQNGNVYEWNESALNAPNDAVAEFRVRRGGGWANDSIPLDSSTRLLNSPTDEQVFIGFRVAMVPEPTSASLLGMAALGVSLRRKRQ
ncbi:SUMF1/EgtB/PvdO family nonheme iron enzyme [Rubritalea marina]|uniref:SUMF1/EgtB/PvdO family nonheme iron enzyme n=1 Tax=Rubritalea marina TaxID=361055 RepID=UPI00037762B6|nr:SUMF1/EgtB/PvdO family nonheme iron enzyme [Rubritalea marina]